MTSTIASRVAPRLVVTDGSGQVRRAAGPAVLLAALVLVLPGCSSGTGTTPTTTSGRPGASVAPSAAPTTNSQAAAKAAAVAAYRAFLADVVAASQTADWRSPRLDDHAAGQPVTAVRDSLQQLQQAGLVARGDVRLSPKVVSLTATTAKISDCQDLTHFLRYDARTGELRDRSSGKRYLAEAALTRVGGKWKVTQFVQAVRVCGTA